MFILDDESDSGGGEGGGDSDLTTATITIANHAYSDAGLFFARPVEAAGDVPAHSESMLTDETYEGPITLYKGSALLLGDDMSDTFTYSVSGDIVAATAVEGQKAYIVTGDCSITIALAE